MKKVAVYSHSFHATIAPVAVIPWVHSGIKLWIVFLPQKHAQYLSTLLKQENRDETFKSVSS